MIARHEILIEQYCYVIRIEALTMVEIARKEILPAVMRYSADLAEAINVKKTAAPKLKCNYEAKLVTWLSALIDGIDEAADVLEHGVADMKGDTTAQAFHIRDTVLGRMAALRKLCDEAETVTAADYWPFPTYGDLLFGV